MALVFTQEEKDKMREALDNVVSDLRSIYEESESDKISYEFKTIENGKEYEYYLGINKKEAYIVHKYSDWYMNLDKRQGKKYKTMPIKDYTLVFEFLKKYDTIRSGVVSLAKKSAQQKRIGMRAIEAIMDKYSKEAVIEVEMPETVNQTTIEVIEEDGKNVGRINIGPLSLKILASPSVKIVGKTEKGKVKTK